MSLGFDYCGIGVITTKDDCTRVDLYHASKAFRRSFDAYVDKGLDRIDPIAASLFQSDQPVFSNEFYAHAPARLVAAPEPIRTHPTTDGFVAHTALRINNADPRGVGVLGFGALEGGSTQDLTDRVAHHLPILRIAATGYVASIAAARHATATTLLTHSEAQALSLIAQGCTAAEIAQEMGKSAATIRNQIASAKQRLGARNTAQAVFLAQQLGAIRG